MKAARPASPDPIGAQGLLVRLADEVLQVENQLRLYEAAQLQRAPKQVQDRPAAGDLQQIDAVVQALRDISGLLSAIGAQLPDDLPIDTDALATVLRLERFESIVSGSERRMDAENQRVELF